jgi:hypothetical protein
MGREPIRRNWLKEAYMIAKGMDIPPKKEHVQVVIDQLIGIKTEAEKLRGLMLVAYKEACKKRKEQGLEIPPMPPSLIPRDQEQ